MCKPIIKWVGGKRQLIADLKRLMPKNYNRYFEPFIGGGALFFELKPKNAFINDYNPELTNLYTTIRDNPMELIEDLTKHKNESEYYYKTRALDRDKKVFSKLSNIQRASRFIYLNKTGFNGLYRVNSKGECNVPFGRYKNPKYCDSENIQACSELLKNTQINNGDFESVKEYVKEGDFVYFDPPYVPLNATSSFTGYTDQGFDEDMQFRLKELCDYINDVGAYFMLSNSSAEYVYKLYHGYTIHEVKATRNINSNASKRGKVTEVVVTNYHG
ncbi:MAG: DNA adenine methylase [Campylobacterales bacterium]|nr:DNA adenine methylase [Campylobacterales bacterium]